ncbi:protein MICRORCHIDIA 6 isoform X2 [Prosopis cineraria]|uniref:protein MICRORCHIDIA 6 isoform X2 n=1 Tax=Prosopis cineraria TaxID=364024 RepID=UPI00240FAA89|nr:protein MICRORCHIDIA 6 isoform X2 [Prosopis cineraria]XP_054805723.1 protein MICRORCHIDIA 6 isoform X2 [Prosopis cineraria]
MQNNKLSPTKSNKPLIPVLLNMTLKRIGTLVAQRKVLVTVALVCWSRGCHQLITQAYLIHHQLLLHPFVGSFGKPGIMMMGLVLKSQFKIADANHYLHVHPEFLHSNATSHKWAFGAIAELLDNAFDEIQNGATFVIVDKTSNPKDGSPALLIQDDGGGMDPEAMRCCMSFGFSDKKSKFAIGKYGNGFKTSTMRLGADVIVFSRHLNKGVMTQSIGLLSFTFLMQTGLDRIVVPMVSYEFNTSTNMLEMLNGREHFMSNLSMLLRWSPYSSEAELLNQLDDIGPHGTKVIIYNLWFNDDGNLELDFDKDPEDICIAGDIKKVDTIPAWKTVNEQHIANRFKYSLRVYLSILYLRVPESFRIILRGQGVEPHNIADDLKFPEYILYRPSSGGCKEGTVVTTIGFLKEAPHVNIHGFNVYHKNRLILPFWQVVSYSDSRGRGVVGVLQADFIEPIHNKQDFERTSLFQKLEIRLKEMTWEYWDYHCGLIGYQVKRKSPLLQLEYLSHPPGIEKPLTVDRKISPVLSKKAALQSGSQQGSRTKRKTHELIDVPDIKKHARRENEITGVACSHDNIQTMSAPARLVGDQDTIYLMEENKKLRAKCLQFEKEEQELNLKVTELKSKILGTKREYERLLAELQSLGMKEE